MVQVSLVDVDAVSEVVDSDVDVVGSVYPITFTVKVVDSVSISTPLNNK